MSDLYELAADLLNPSGWRANAACRGHDPELWFPEKGSDWALPLSVCRVCPSAQECLDERMADKSTRTYDDGIFGGTTQLQRAQIRSGMLPQTPNPEQLRGTERLIQELLNPEPPAPVLRERGKRRSPRPEVGELDNCGTEQGYQRHRKRGEVPCHACTTGHADAYHERGAA